MGSGRTTDACHRVLGLVAGWRRWSGRSPRDVGVVAPSKIVARRASLPAIGNELLEEITALHWGGEEQWVWAVNSLVVSRLHESPLVAKTTADGLCP